ncbi:MAG: hypothetical protein V3V49_06655 [Candidatus Krumholzibacteria bacterium]
MKKLSTFLICLAIFPLVQCSDNPVDEGTIVIIDQSKADSIASNAFEALGDSIQALEDKSTEELKNTRFDDTRRQFQNALSFDPRNAIAHVGLAILEIVELNYDTDIWAVIDSMERWTDEGPTPPPTSARDRHRMLIGRQFSLLVEIPFALNVHAAASFPSNVTLAKIQAIIRDTVIPALDRSINHLETAEADIDAAIRILIDDSGVQEYIKIDLGEIFLFDASVRALRAGFGMVIAYDADLFGPDGTYDWIDHVRYLEDHRFGLYCAKAEVIPGSPFDELKLVTEHGFADAQIDSILLLVLYHNLENRPAFLTLRDSGKSMREAHQNFLMTVNKLDASANFIRNVRQNENEENVVKLADLTDLDSELDPTDPDIPNFAKDFNRVEDVLDFVRDLLNGPVDFSEQLGANDITFSWTMNLNAWFTAPVTDWKALLPYYRFVIPAGNWIDVNQTLVFEYDNGGFGWTGFVLVDDFCTYTTIPNIGIVRQYSRRYDVDDGSILELLDGPGGNVIDVNLERFPYFPDYTFNGLFPDMDTRDRWLTLVDILDPPPAPPPPAPPPTAGPLAR